MLNIARYINKLWHILMIEFYEVIKKRTIKRTYLFEFKI